MLQNYIQLGRLRNVVVLSDAKRQTNAKRALGYIFYTVKKNIDNRFAEYHFTAILAFGFSCRMKGTFEIAVADLLTAECMYNADNMH